MVPETKRKAAALVPALAMALIVAACTSTPGGQPALTGAAGGSPDDGGGGEGGTVEIFSWWTAGGEADGLEAMFGVFNEKFPQYEIENAAVAGGAGTNARAVLATRLAQNDPPESWRGDARRELIGSWGDAGGMETLEFVYGEEGCLDGMCVSLVWLRSA